MPIASLRKFPFHFAGAPAALSLLGAAAGLLSGACAWAEPAAPLDRASISVGAFYADPHIDARADTRYGRIDSGNYQPDHVTLPRVRADLLLGDSQGLSFDYYRYDKRYRPDLAGSSNFEGVPLSGKGKLDAKLKLDLAKLAYKWWIGSGADVFGVGVGAAYYHAALEGTASGTLNGVAGDASYSETAHTFAPLLELGWRHAFSPQVRSFVEVSGIKKNGGSVNGHIYGGTVGVEWLLAKNVGLVADYSVSKISLNRDADRDSDLNIRLNGPAAYVKMRF